MTALIEILIIAGLVMFIIEVFPYAMSKLLDKREEGQHD